MIYQLLHNEENITVGSDIVGKSIWFTKSYICALSLIVIDSFIYKF